MRTWIWTLSVSAPESQPPISEPDWGASEPLDESEFLSALGVSETQTQPVAADLSSAAAAPLMPEPVVVADDEFVPRENLNFRQYYISIAHFQFG